VGANFLRRKFINERVSLKEVLDLPEGEWTSIKWGYVTRRDKNMTVDAMFLRVQYKDLQRKHGINFRRVHKQINRVHRIILNRRQGKYKDAP
jgi:hypothetical protein